MIRISIIIPVYNAEKTLKKCLKGISECINNTSELILVDNNSTDKSFSICEDFKASSPNIRTKLKKEFKKGPSSARNNGALSAEGEWLLFTDSDCVPTEDWLVDFLTHFNDSDIGAVAGCIKPFPPSNMVQKIQSLFTLSENQYENIYKSSNIIEGLFPAANLAVKKDVFNLVGGFNETLLYGEDRDLCYKIYQAGYGIKAVRNAVVEHIHRTKLIEFIKQSFCFGTSHPYELRHSSKGSIIILSPFLKINKYVPDRYIWIDLNQADKKILFLLLPIFFGWPFLSFLSCYLLYLCYFIYKKSLEKNIKTNLFELPILAFLLVLKSVLFTFGRVTYSFKFRVLCF